jgi:hypothetical protein
MFFMSLYTLYGRHGSGTTQLYARLPSLGLHAQKVGLRPAVLRGPADNAV